MGWGESKLEQPCKETQRTRNYILRVRAICLIRRSESSNIRNAFAREISRRSGIRTGLVTAVGTVITHVYIYMVLLREKEREKGARIPAVCNNRIYIARYNRRNRGHPLPSSAFLCTHARYTTTTRMVPPAGKDFRDRQLAIMIHSAHQSMLIDTGQARKPAGETRELPREHFYSCGESARADTAARSVRQSGENCVQFARK